MSVDCLSPHLHNCCHLHCFHLQPNVILQRPADICFTVCNCRVHKLTDPNLLPDKQFSICGKSHTHSIACFGLLLLSSQSAHSQAEISLQTVQKDWKVHLQLSLPAWTFVHLQATLQPTSPPTPLYLLCLTSFIYFPLWELHCGTGQHGGTVVSNVFPLPYIVQWHAVSKVRLTTDCQSAIGVNGWLSLFLSHVTYLCRVNPTWCTMAAGIGSCNPELDKWKQMDGWSLVYVLIIITIVMATAELKKPLIWEVKGLFFPSSLDYLHGSAPWLK